MKDKLITQILQVNAVCRMINSDRLPEDRKKMISQGDLLLSLAFLSEAELTKIAKALHITI